MTRIILSAAVLVMGVLLSACTAQTDTENNLEGTSEATAEIAAEAASFDNPTDRMP